VEKLAKGRIWTGEDAKQLGLVDELGGFPAALRLIRIAAKLPDNAAIRLKVFPEQKPLTRVLSALKRTSAEDETDGALARMLEEAQPIVRAFGPMGSSSGAGVLRMREFE
jgi:protease-4